MHHKKRKQNDMQAQNTMIYSHYKEHMQNNMLSQTKPRLTFNTGITK